jgi:predicted RND superfamily exporter protein
MPKDFFTSIVMATGMLLVSSCATVETKEVKEQPTERRVKVKTVSVSASCQKAIARQTGQAGFALVIHSASDILSTERIEFLDRLYRKIHGTPGILSVNGIADEQVLSKTDLGIAVEPFVSDSHDDPNLRMIRYRKFSGLIDPVLLSSDQGVTILVVRLLPTSKKKARSDIRAQLHKLTKTAPAGIKINLVEYPVAAAESLTWHTEHALTGLKILNQRLAGAGVLEVGVSCKQDDCLLTPLHLSSISRFEKIVKAMPRVKATRSLATVLRHTNQAVSGVAQLPATADQALQLMAMLDLSSGIGLLVDKKNRRCIVRVYFETGNAADYCALGKALKKATKDSSSESLRFFVRKPEHRGF